MRSTDAASVPPSIRPRADARLRLRLDDGDATTVHVARWDLRGTRVRIERLAAQQPVVEWCSGNGCQDALVGGFYTRPEGHPLGELRLRGRAVRHVPFSSPWNTTRASLHVADGAVSIARRDALPLDARGDLLQAGPLLVAGGRVVYHDGVDSEGFSSGADQFDSDITAARHPRAAIGIGEHELIAAVADGRSPRDAGVSLGELAQLMLRLGADAAMNLDGGGSASLVCDGQLRNRPREQHGIRLDRGRAVTTVIAFDAA